MRNRLKISRGDNFVNKYNNSTMILQKSFQKAIILRRFLQNHLRRFTTVFNISLYSLMLCVFSNQNLTPTSFPSSSSPSSCFCLPFSSSSSSTSSSSVAPSTPFAFAPPLPLPQDCVLWSVQMLGTRSSGYTWSPIGPRARFRICTSIPCQEFCQWKTLDCTL